jgi:hypothetical protein
MTFSYAVQVSESVGFSLLDVPVNKNHQFDQISQYNHYQSQLAHM